jgi:hypothetical protein
VDAVARAPVDADELGHHGLQLVDALVGGDKFGSKNQRAVGKFAERARLRAGELDMAVSDCFGNRCTP